MLLHHSIPTKIIEAVYITADRTIFLAKEDAVLNAKEIGELAVMVGYPVIWHITVGLMECVPIQAMNLGAW